MRNPVYIITVEKHYVFTRRADALAFAAAVKQGGGTPILSEEPVIGTEFAGDLIEPERESA